MPGYVRPVADERDGLLVYLAQQRYGLRVAAHGLTDEQAAAAPSASTLSIGGVIKHLVRVERTWVVGVLAQRELPPPREWAADFRMENGETLAGLLADYDQVASETEEIIRGLDSMDHPVPVPQGVPWFPGDVKEWSARWVLLHLVEETARHAGHADIVRESLDGKDFYTLLAEYEGKPTY